ncbi:hypothetical protein [Synechococcus sp. EJ6-Ellesmere]|uniref:hypothetical protein n=1 Tax=Synechococcus sp. EJ6-Ellesmere TaxID=2823734 RepID=UPI0020CE3D70|nr:hypothetical protein [Synechococcus sp. EJ6-Ellesmere]MCP9824507.1 hypothetical protein [Synechococcus sp. EJ6-Ellesmere]
MASAPVKVPPLAPPIAAALVLLGLKPNRLPRTASRLTLLVKARNPASEWSWDHAAAYQLLQREVISHHQLKGPPAAPRRVQP